MVRMILTAVMVMTATTLVGCGQPMAAVAPSARMPVAQAQAKVSDADRLLATAKAEIKRFDLNKNGTLSQMEFVDGRFSQVRFFKAPTAAEVASMKANFAKTFNKLDANKDGALTAQELVADYTQQ
jgi:Ca2+-binding EF-hand superfamily protein